MPSPNYRPDPSRGIFLVGIIDQQMVDRLTPEILKLQAAGRAPISVFIESPGGDIHCAEKIFSLLQASDDSGDRCQIITVATGLAASAAADLLTFGDYALAYPHSVIHYHGSRLSQIDVTYAEAAQLTADLDIDGAHFASRLIDACEERFLFRCMAVQSRPDFAGWIETTLEKLSPTALEVARDAQASMEGFRQTIGSVKPHLNAESALLKALINRSFPKPTGPVAHASVFETLSEFFLLRFYLKMLRTMRTRRAYQRWLEGWTKDGASQMTDEELVDLGAGSLQSIQLFWMFFLALCRRLKQKENPLSSADAFHLGLMTRSSACPIAGRCAFW